MEDKITQATMNIDNVENAITEKIAEEPESVSKVEVYLIEEYAPKMHMAIQFTEPSVKKDGWLKTHIKWSDSEKMQPVLVLRGALCLSALGHVGNPCGLCGYRATKEELDALNAPAEENK